VTAAALLMAVVFVALATGQVAVVKIFGVGLALAVLVDAFLIERRWCPPSCACRAGQLGGPPDPCGGSISSTASGRPNRSDIVDATTHERHP